MPLKALFLVRNKLTTLLVFEQSSVARNGQLGEFVNIILFPLYIKLQDLVMLYA